MIEVLFLKRLSILIASVWAGARHGGCRGRGAGGRVVVAPAFAPLGQRDDSALRLRYVALHGVVQAADRQIPDYDRVEVALLRGGGRRPALRPEGDRSYGLRRHCEACAFPDAVRADGADLSAQPDAQLCAEERARDGVEHIHLFAARAGDRHFGGHGTRQTARRHGDFRLGDLRRGGAGAPLLLGAAAACRSADGRAALGRRRLRCV